MEMNQWIGPYSELYQIWEKRTGARSSWAQTTHRLPWGRCRAGWSGPGRSCGWAGWCRSGPLLSPGCSAGSAPSCCPSPPASPKLRPSWTTTPKRSGRPFCPRRTSPNSARPGPWGRPTPSGLLLPLRKEGKGKGKGMKFRIRRGRRWRNLFDLIKEGYWEQIRNWWHG